MLNNEVANLDASRHVPHFNEDNFREIIIHHTDGILVVDMDWMILFANHASERLLARGTLAGTRFEYPAYVHTTNEIELVSSTNNQEKISTLRIKVEPIEWNGESALVVFLRDATEQKQARTTLQQAKDELKTKMEARAYELNKANEYLLDQIAERRRAERAFRRALTEMEQAKDQIDAIFKSVADGLIVTDIYNRVMMMNHAAENLLGIYLSDVHNQLVDFAIKNDILRERIKTTLLENERTYLFDFELTPLENKTGKNGLSTIIRARTAVIRDKVHQPSGVITIIHDVTREREVDRLKTEFISTASHELRTPLTSIQGFSEILLARDTFTREEQKKYLSYINHQAEAMSKIVNDLLNVSRIESGQSIGLEAESCSIAESIGRVVRYFEELSDIHRFEVALAEYPPVWIVDREKIEQVLKNLLTNATKYSPDGGLIKVNGQCHREPGSDTCFYQVSVADEGIGMTPDQVDRIFDKFYRADASNTAIGGIGLGMSIVKSIIEAHGGRIWVDSRPGEGTTVSFTIPVNLQ